MTDDIRDLVRVLGQAKAPPGHGIDQAPHFDPEKIQCVCKEWRPLTDMELLNTGAINAISNVCRGCKSGIRLDRGMSRVVCCTCKRVVARIAPHKDKSGFRYEANLTYHTEQCGFCTPGLKESSIIEKKIRG